ncbi:MAG: tetratricopeptide repeat protein [Candidatus Electrothrix sp. LOE1_4_5]|nr:tetratricopeptide repeat protein [Candidatus Electrothrix gigas]
MDKLKAKVERKRNVILGMLLICVTFSIYAKTWTHEFIGYDDDNYVTGNPYVTNGINRENLFWAIRSTHVSNWHPITWLSHMLDVEFYGMNAGGHHLTSLLFHIGNSLLLFILFSKMTGCIRRSFIVAFLFAIHPLHVESVAWVAERKDVLSTFFALLALWYYLRYVRCQKITSYLLMTVFFILALMSKPMVVTLPFVLLLLDYWPLKRIRFGQNNPVGNIGTQRSAWQLVYEKIPLIVLTGISCVVTFIVQQKGGAVALPEVYPLGMRLANALTSYVKYLQKTVLPYDLAILYPYPKAITAGQIGGATILLAGITLFVLRYCKRFPWLFVGWFWYIGTLLPVIGIVQAGVQSMADRYTYISLTGIFIILSWGLTEFFRNRHYNRILLSAVTVGVFSALAIISWRQVSFWKNSISLFTHTLEVTKNNYVIHNNLGFELALLGQKKEALKQYKEAVRINPNFEQAHINYASLLFSLGKVAESFSYYQEVLKNNPTFARTHYSFAVQLLKTGKNESASHYFIEALRIKPDLSEAYNGLGAVMVSLGRTSEAIDLFKKAIQINPYLIEAKKNLESLSQYNQPQAKQ